MRKSVKPKRKRAKNIITLEQNPIVFIYDTADNSYSCHSVKAAYLQLTQLEIAILRAENLPQATGLRPE